MVSDHRALKKLSLDFRSIAGRALRSDADEAQGNLRRLLSYVRQQPLLVAEIERAPTPASDATELWKQACQNSTRLELPEDPIAELGALHAAVTCFAEYPQRISGLVWGYAGERNLSECVTEAVHDVVGKYVDQLSRVIEIALLDSADPAYGPARSISVHVSGGTAQVNLAQDQARVQAAQHLGTDAGALVERVLAAVGDLQRAAASAGLSPDEREEVEEIVHAVAEELRQPQPRTFTLKAAKTKLEQLAASTTAVQTVVTQAATAAGLLVPLLEHLRALGR